MNVALSRVLYAHALVASPKLALGRARAVSRLLGDPRWRGADLFLTLERLLGPEYCGPEDLGSLRKLRVSHPCFLTYFGLRDMPVEVLREAEGYYWDSWNSDQVATSAFKIFVPTLFEPALAPAGGQIVIVQKLTDLDYDAMTDWTAHKLAVEQYIITNLERRIPGLREKIVVKLSASAFTSHKYTLNHHGAMLGWEMSPDQLGSKRPDVVGPIKNLYLVGHWTQPGGGITPVIVSAMRAAKMITRSSNFAVEAAALAFANAAELNPRQSG